MGRLRRARARYPKNYCPIDALECLATNEKGQCVVNWNKKVYTVDEMIVGELANIIVYYEEEKTGDARAIKLVLPSPVRALPLAHPKMKLGSYHLAHMTEAAQDAWKQAQVESVFGQATKPIKVGQRTNYRNKVVLHDGGFMPSGRNRKQAIIPEPGAFDLMEIDFAKYKDIQGDWIIRRLDKEIAGRPGDEQNTTHSVMGKKFSVNLNSFYQVNNEMTEKAYTEMIGFVPEGSIVFDLFAGAATIGIHVADKAKEVYAVEINKSSHKDALKNIALNNVANVHAILGDANAFIATSQVRPDVIIVDPARSGLMPESVVAMNNSSAKTIIYLSCNIFTQINDIKGLTNYALKHIQPYDFFPQTYHIENLVVLEKK